MGDPGAADARSALVRALAEARDLIEAGDQGDAEALLARALTQEGPAQDPAEAIALAEATGLLIRLRAPIDPLDALVGLAERMHALTAGFEDGEPAVARAEAELQTIEWVHEDTDDNDPVVLVDVLRLASAFAARCGASPIEGVRRAGAEAGLTALMIRNWIGQPSSSAVVGLESLALSLAGEEDPRMRAIRVLALRSAADRLDDDPEHARLLLRTALDESGALPDAARLGLPILLRLVDLALAADGDAAAELDELLAALREGPQDAGDAALRCGLLDLALDRVAAEHRAAVAAAEWAGMIGRCRRSADPGVRTAMLVHLRFRGGDEALTAADLRLLRDADAAFADDHDPETEDARLRLALRIVEVVGHPADGSALHGAAGAAAPDPALAVRLSEEVEGRFGDAGLRAGTAPEILRMLVDRALRLSDLGRRDEALSLLAGLPDRFAGADEPGPLRHLLAQADYWAARGERERGGTARADGIVFSMADRLGRDPDPDVRVWAANALFSAWRAEGVAAADAERASARFQELFADDLDPRIRRLDAGRRNSAAHRAHESGDPDAATALFGEVVERYGDDPDEEIAERVALARENLRILALTAERPGSAGADPGYRALRDRLYAADALDEEGRVEEAVPVWRAVADEAAASADADTAMLGLAALDAWSAHLEETGRWHELHDVARRALVIRPDADGRAERVRARAHLRLATALHRLGDPRSAVAVHEALEVLVAGAEDDDLVAARQQGAYNRAVLLDDLGETEAALAAYDHVLAVHVARVDSPARRLRRVKALRNKALLLEGLGRVAETAGAHRLVLDIAVAAPDEELAARARPSAFALAECFTRLGDQASAAATYAWIRTAIGLGFTDADLRAAARAQKTAEREARRQRR